MILSMRATTEQALALAVQRHSHRVDQLQHHEMQSAISRPRENHHMSESTDIELLSQSQMAAYKYVATGLSQRETTSIGEAIEALLTKSPATAEAPQAEARASASLT
jgi:hypothetical protein